MRREPSRRVDLPEPGFFAMRLVRGGVRVAAKIIRTQDGMWGAEINGEPAGAPSADPARAAGVMRIWQGATRIDADEYTYLLAVKRHADAHPEHPSATPERAVNVAALPSIF